MKAKLFAIASGTIESGGGIVISAIWEDLLWLGWLLIGIGVVSLILGFAWHRVVTVWKWFQVKTRMAFRVTKGIKEANKLLTTREVQQKSPEKWLHPVIEYIDLNRQGSANDDRDVYVRFQIDSHLLFDIPEFYVYARLNLSVPETVLTNESAWYELEMQKRYPPMNSLSRYPFSGVIHLRGDSDQEKQLLKWMAEFRDGKRLLAMLVIGIAFKKRQQFIPLEGNGPSHIAPMNDYRGS